MVLFVAGREAADGAADRNGDPVVKQEKPKPATSAKLPPGFAQPALNGHTDQLEGMVSLINQRQRLLMGTEKALKAL